MTEEQWRACGDPEAMFTFLVRVRRDTTGRKQRLFNCACCRRLGKLLTGVEIWKVIDAAERYADDEIAESTADKWHRRTRAAQDECSGEYVFGATWKAFEAVASTILPWRYGFQRVYEDAAEALATDAVGDGRSEAWELAKADAGRGFAQLLREVVGDPFGQVVVPPSWRSADVLALAEAAYSERALPGGELDRARLAVLSDALEEAGCADDAVLSHLQSSGPHVRGCWALDLVLGKT